jgi:hypothetical protein
MTPEAARATYRRLIGENGETVLIRRYTGTGSGARPTSEWSGRARVIGYDAAELIGGIVQGDRRIILLHEDLVAGGCPLPIQTGANWKAVVRGVELQIKAVDDNTRRIAGELIAHEIRAGG